MRINSTLWSAAAVVGVCALGCGSEVVRPRSAGEAITDRPGRALIVGQFKIATDPSVDSHDVGMTAHQLYAGTDVDGFRAPIIDDGRMFMLWVRPGVFCYGQPTYGKPPAALGKAPCVEIPDPGKAYYVGTVLWTAKKASNKATADIEIKNNMEAVSSSALLTGIYMEPALVSQDLDPKPTAAKYKTK